MGAKISKKRKAVSACRAVIAPKSWPALLAVTGLAGDRLATAATIRSDVADSNYTALGGESQYAASGFIDLVIPNSMEAFGSGTLIAPDWVLTAAHVVTQNPSGAAYPAADVTFGQGASTTPFVAGPDAVSSVQVESGWSYNLNQGNDLALVQLSTPITNVTPAVLYPSSLAATNSELTQTATIIGYGSSGTGLTGDTIFPGTRRGIQNTIDALGGATTTGGTGLPYSFSGLSTNVMLTDFDEPGVAAASIMGGTAPLALEGCSAPGDSGGGLFLTVNGQTYLAGVTDFVGSFSNNPLGSSPNGYYGDYNGYTQTSVPQSLSFIDSILEVASAWKAAGAGSWENLSNWSSGGIPEFAGATANFGSSITSAATINLDANWTVGTINFSSTHTYTLAAGNGGTITLDGGNGASGIISDNGGTHVISAPLMLNTNAVVAVVNAGDAVTISGPISGGGSLVKIGLGNLLLSGSGAYTGATGVSGGLLEVNRGSAYASTPYIQVAAGGTAGADDGSTADTAFVQLLTQAPSQAGGFALSAADANVDIDFTGTAAGAFNMVQPVAGATLSLANMSIGVVSGGVTYTGTITPANHTYQFGGGGTLVLAMTSAGSVPLVDGSAANNLLVENGGTVVLPTSNSYSGVTTIQGVNVLINPANNSTALETSVLQVTYLGDSDSSIGSGNPNNPANLVINGGTLRYVGGGDVSSRLFTIGALGATLDSSGSGALALGNAGAEAFSGAISGVATLTLTGSNSGGNLLAGSIADPPGGQLALAKSGGGTWTVSGVNTFSGGTAISGGLLRLGANDASGTGPLALSEAELDLNGFSATAGGISGTGVVDDISGGGAATLTMVGNTTSTFAGVIGNTTGTLALAMSGTGTQVLTGINTYSGGTTLNSGELSIAFDSNIGGTTSPITFDGGVLRVTGTGLTTIGNHAVNWSSFNGGFDIASPADVFNVTANLAGGGSLAKLGAGTLVLTGINTYAGATSLQGGLLEIPADTAVAGGAGGITFSGGALQFNSYSSLLSFTGTSQLMLGAAAGGASSLAGTITDGANQTALTYIGPGTLVLGALNTYSGGTSIQGGELSIGSAGNIGGGNISFTGGTLQITGTALSSLATIKGSGFTGGFDVASSGNVFTVSAPLTGGGSLSKLGAGTLVLSGSNNYSGGTTLSAGTLQLGVANALGSGSLVMGPGAALDLHGYSPAIAGISGSGVIDDLSSMNAALTDTVTTASSFLGTIQNSAGGWVSFNKAGSGTLTLSGLNTYGGGTTISAGSLVLGNASALGSPAGPLADGGELDLHGFSVSVGNLSGSGTIDNLTSTPATLTVVQNSTGTFSGLIQNSSGLVSLTKAGGGILDLADSNSFSGGTTINAGTLQLGNAAALGGSAAAVTVNGGVLDLHGLSPTLAGLSGTGTVDDLSSAASTLTVASSSNPIFAGVIQNSSAGLISLTKGGTGTLTFTGSNTYGGNTTITLGALQIGSGGNTGSPGTGAILDGTSLVINRGDTSLVLSNPISLGGSVTVEGTGLVTFNASNSYSGGTSITSGTARAGNAGAFGSGGVLIAGNGVLDLNGSNLNLSGISGAGTVDDVSGGGSPLLTINGSATSIFSGVIRNTSGSLAVSRAGTGTLVLSGINTYSGGTTVQSGDLQLGNSAALGAGNGGLTLNGGLLDLHGFSPAVGTLSGGGTMDDVSTTNSTLTVNSASTSTLGGVIQNTHGGLISLVKSGIGTLALSGINTYSGGTTIQGGAVQLGIGGTKGSINGPIVDSAALVIDRSDSNFPFNNAISGGGVVDLIGPGTVTFGGVNTYGGETEINSGTLVISAPASLPTGGEIIDNSSLTIPTGASASPVLAGNISGTGSLIVGTTVQSAYLRLAANSGISSQGKLTINTGSTLDINDNSLAINFSSPANDPAAAIRAEIQSGYNGDAWTGSGLTSSAAAANPGEFAVGYADGNVDSGMPAQANQILVKYTLAGDANLDGLVNFSDLLAVAQDYGRTGQDWADGDFNYDGLVNFSDLLLVAQNYGKSLTAGQLAELPGSFSSQWQLAETEIQAAGVSPVPEPAGIALLGTAAAGLLARRRRRYPGK